MRFASVAVLAAAVVMSLSPAARARDDVVSCPALRGTSGSFALARFDRTTARPGGVVGICNVRPREIPRTWRLFILPIAEARAFGDARSSVADPQAALGPGARPLTVVARRRASVVVRVPRLRNGGYTLAYWCPRCGRLLGTVWPAVAMGASSRGTRISIRR